jgi:hypothetical protein
MLLQGNQGQTGKQTGQNLTVGLGEFSELLVSQLMAKFYQANYRGLKFCASVGGAGQALAAANLFSTAIATFQPIFALYNPLTSLVNLVLQHLWCGVTADPASAGVTGGFFLVGQAGQSITNAASVTPVNLKTLRALGSVAIPILNAVLAGAAGNPLLLRPISSLIVPTAEGSTATPVLGAVPVEEVAGSVIIPPGGYVGIANGISNTTATVIAGAVWDEIPI